MNDAPPSRPPRGEPINQRVQRKINRLWDRLMGEYGLAAAPTKAARQPKGKRKEARQ